MQVSIRPKGIMGVSPGHDPEVPLIVAYFEDKRGGGCVGVYMTHALALELASKIESCYQGIVGPVPPEPAIQKNGDLTGARSPA